MIWGYHYFWKHPHDVIPSEGVKMARLLPVFPVFSSRFFNEPSPSIPNKQRKNLGLEKKTTSETELSRPQEAL